MQAAIDITTAAVSRRVAHLAAVKRDLSITDTSEDANLLQAIDIVSAGFARAMGREPWMQTYTVRLPGDGGTFLRLPVFPLVSVSEVADGGPDSYTAITASEYEIESTATASERRDRIFRKNGWAKSPAYSPTRHSSQDRALLYRVQCVAGYAAPIDKWAASTAVRLGEYTRETDRAETLRHEVTTAGTTGSTEPTWATTAGATTSDGTAVWTARAAIEMPHDLWAAAMWAVKMVYSRADLLAAQPPGVKSMAGGGMRIEWGAEGNGAAAASLLPALSYQIAEAYA